MKFCLLKTPCSTTLTKCSFSCKMFEQENTKIQNLLNVWLKRSQNLSFVLKYDIDIFVIDTEPSPEHATWLYPHHSGSSKNIIKSMHPQSNTSIHDIDFNKYNVVITSDCFVPDEIIQKYKNTLWCYYEDEHAYDSFQRSRLRPSKKYDVFLNHYLDSGFTENTLPQSISFPYLENPECFAKMLKVLEIKDEKKNTIFLDHYIFRIPNTQEIIQKIQNNTQLKPVYSYKPSGKGTIFDLQSGVMPHVNEYLSIIGSCKYFLYMRGNNGIGQATLPIASSKCIIVGVNTMTYAKLIMHPFCVANDIDACINIINKLENNVPLKNEIIQYQLDKVNEHFWNSPLKQLSHLLNYKLENTKY